MFEIKLLSSEKKKIAKGIIAALMAFNQIHKEREAEI